MKLSRKVLTLCLFVWMATGLSGAMAADKPAAVSDDLVLKGDAVCTKCHDESDSPELLTIGKTKHGTQADSRTPTCTSCHGTSQNHLKSKSTPPDVTFTAKSTAPIQARNEACMSCHKNDAKRSHWEGSTHQTRDLACSTCHKIHAAKDTVRDKRTQTEVCFSCHKDKRTQMNKPSHHPVIEGKMACSDCHNPHGSAGPRMLKRNSVVETCYDCHMEKRGPFVHNHQPVNDDCTICHNPHGTTAENLLKTRAPFLCQTCHTPHGAIQPSVAVAPGATSQGWWNGSTIAQGRSCLNCHTQVHGSNNPSSVNPTPQRLFR